MGSLIAGVKNSAVLQGRQRVESDRYGVDVITLEEVVPDNFFPAKFRAMGSSHPRFATMAISRRSAERMEGAKLWRVSYTYEGFMLSLPDPTYELSGSLNQEPIQVHENFEDFAGTASAPLNNAVFIDPETGRETTNDSKGVFREFSKGEFMGVDSFLDPSATWSVVYFTTSLPSLRNLGKIDSPDGPSPGLSGRNWMMFEQSARKRGHIYEVRLTWKLSGRGGWNSDIY